MLQVIGVRLREWHTRLRYTPRINSNHEAVVSMLVLDKTFVQSPLLHRVVLESWLNNLKKIEIRPY